MFSVELSEANDNYDFWGDALKTSKQGILISVEDFWLYTCDESKFEFELSVDFGEHFSGINGRLSVNTDSNLGLSMVSSALSNKWRLFETFVIYSE